MFKDNPLLAELKQQIRETLPSVEGTVKATDKGYGFLEVDRKTSHFIPPPHMKKVLHGDVIKAVVRTEGDRTSAEPEELVTPFLTRFVAKLGQRRDRWFVEAEHPMIKQTINAKVMLDKPAKLKVGDWVLAELVRHPLKGDNSFFAHIVHKVAAGDDPFAAWQCTLARHNLPVVEPEVPEQLALLDEGLERKDLTSLEMFTIDSESTMDVDDALAIESTETGWKLTVAIADPTAYIEAGSELDQAARDRAFTVYLPGRNISMIPSRLSEELCSLMPGEDRPALVGELEIAQDGSLQGEPTVYLAMVRSHHKLSYDNVSDWLEKTGEWQPQSDTLSEQLNALHQMTLARSNWRNTHAITFPDRPDYRFELNDDGTVKAIHADQRRLANSMIEESMVVANIALSTWLREKVERAIYNVHAGFEEEHIEAATALIGEHEGTATPESLQSLQGYCELRRWLDSQPSGYLDSRLRKLQSFSEVQVEPGQHFGMGLECYGTWTSPIRKYGDMINHRLVKAVLRDDQEIPQPGEEDALHLTELLKKNRFAERDLSNWLYAQYLAPHVDSKTQFEAEIFDINRGGLRARLQENGAMVFVPASTLHSDRRQVQVNPDEGLVLVQGEQRYKLADPIKVVLTEVKLQNRSLVATVVE